MTLYQVKPAFQQGLQPLARWAIRARVSADELTIAAVVVSLVGGIALAISGERPILLLTALPVVLARLALNALDGMVARATGAATPAGELLNELGDRLGDLLLVGGLVVAGHGDMRLGAVALAVITLPGAVGVAARAAGGARRYEGPLSKPDRMAALAGAAVLAQLFAVGVVIDWYFALLILGALVTAANRYRQAYLELSRLSGGGS